MNGKATKLDQNKKSDQHVSVSEPAQKGWLIEVRRNVVSLTVMLALVFGIKETVLGSYRIPSESMVSTLMVGDLLFTWNLSYGLRLPFGFETTINWSEPDRGDVVVFRRDNDPLTPENETDINLVKRVIGLPGDTMEVNSTQVLINGKALDESAYAIWQQGGQVDFGPVKVPAGHVVMLGDNRDYSKDSRLWASGPFLPIKNIRGRAFFIYFSFNNFSRIGNIIR
jgi:signal peptidase I